MLNLAKCCCQNPKILPRTLICQYQCWIWPSVVVKILKICQQHWFAKINAESGSNNIDLLKSMLNLAKCRGQKSKTLPTTVFYGERIFSMENKLSISSQQFCPRFQVIDIFWKNRPKFLNGIEKHVGVLYALNSINSML